MVALIPGTGFAGAPAFDTGTGQDPFSMSAYLDPVSAASQNLAAAGVPPSLGNLGGLMKGLSGVQAPAAPPGPDFSGGIGGAQGVPAPQNISGADSGLAKLLGQMLPAPGQMGQLDTLGAMLKGGGVIGR